MGYYGPTIKSLLDQGYEIFDFDYPLFRADHRPTLERKIIETYYFREIGQETPDRFKHYLKAKMRLIMPYYNKLYESETLDFDPFITDEHFTKRFIEDVEALEREYGIGQARYQETDANTSRNIDRNGQLDSTEKVVTHGEDEHTDDTTGKENTSMTRETTGSKDTTRTEDEDTTETRTTDANATTDGTSEGNERRLFYDTPQSALDASGGLNNNFLTDITNTATTGKTHGESTSHEQVDGKGTRDTTIDEAVTTKENVNELGEKTTTGKLVHAGSEDGTQDSTGHQETEDHERLFNAQNQKQDERATTNYEEGRDTITTTKDRFSKVGRTNRDPSALLKSYRETLLNIDEQIVDRLAPLFMGVY